MTACRRCNRALKNPKAVAAGIGPICATRVAAATVGQPDRDPPTTHDELYDKTYLEKALAQWSVPFQPDGGDFYQGVRSTDGDACVKYYNGESQQIVAHRMFHSPTGIEWGYAGSGPADCARSILTHAAGPILGDAFYQSFKFTFISAWPKAGGRISKTEIAAFLTGILREKVAWLADQHKSETRMCGQCWTEHGQDGLPCTKGCGCHEAEAQP